MSKPLVFLWRKEFGYISYVISNETRSVHRNATKVYERAIEVGLMWISMPKGRSTDYCWRYCLLHRLSRSETLRLRNQSELSRVTWRERSFLKVSRCRAGAWRLKQIRDWPSHRWETRYFGTLGFRRARIVRRNVTNATTSQPKTKETNEAHRGKKIKKFNKIKKMSLKMKIK